MPTMNVSLPPDLAAFVEGEVASGEYGSAGEVVGEALRSLRRERAARDAGAPGQRGGIWRALRASPLVGADLDLSREQDGGREVEI